MKNLQSAEIIHTVKNANNIDFIRITIFESDPGDPGEPYTVFVDGETNDIEVILEDLKSEYSIIGCYDLVYGDTEEVSDGISRYIDLRVRKTDLNHNITDGVINAFKSIVL